MSGKRVLVTGGAGYIGSKLVSELLKNGFKVRVLDLFIYNHSFSGHKNLEIVKGDIRDISLINKVLKDIDAVINLASVSNDPGYEMNAEIGEEINYIAFEPLVKAAVDIGVKQFIYPSSCSVYGDVGMSEVDESSTPAPITDYAICKWKCEQVLQDYTSPSFQTIIFRPATVCGKSERMRFDLSVNQLINKIYHLDEFELIGGERVRPSLHIDDMVSAYLHVLNEDRNEINGKVYNLAYENLTVIGIAEKLSESMNKNVSLIRNETIDKRSYHVISERAEKELRFRPRSGITDAARELVIAFNEGLFRESFTNPYYYNKSVQKDTLFTYYNLH